MVYLIFWHQEGDIGYCIYISADNDYIYMYRQMHKTETKLNKNINKVFESVLHEICCKDIYNVYYAGHVYSTGEFGKRNILQEISTWATLIWFSLALGS